MLMSHTFASHDSTTPNMRPSRATLCVCGWRESRVTFPQEIARVTTDRNVRFMTEITHLNTDSWRKYRGITSLDRNANAYHGEIDGQKSSIAVHLSIAAYHTVDQNRAIATDADV